MGHYAAEMQCDKCGKLRCVCPPKPDESLKMWVVTDDYEVMKASAFEKADGSSMAHFKRIMRTHYPTKKAAKEAAREQIIAAIKDARLRLCHLEKKLSPDSPSTVEKVYMYEGLLHDIQMFSAVVMDGQKVGKLIDNINSWSYAHRCGNGEHSEEEQQAIIDKAFKKLRDR